MRIVAILTTVFVFNTGLFGQKKELDFEAVKNWEWLGNYDISNDGKYVWYQVLSESKGTILFVSDVNGRNKREFVKSTNPKFSADSRYIFFVSTEGLHQLELKTGRDEIVRGANNYDLSQESAGRWLTYSVGVDLLLRDLKTGEKTCFSNVNNSLFNKQGDVLLLQTDSSLSLVRLPGKNKQVIFWGKGIDRLIFDNDGTQLAFSTTNRKRTEIFTYTLKGDKLEMVVNDSSASMPAGHKVVRGDLEFSENGKLLYFKISKNMAEASKDRDIITKHLQIWNYKDVFLPSDQTVPISGRRFLSVISKDSKTVVQLEDDSTLLQTVADNFALVKSFGNYSEAYWRKSQSPRYKLISLANGKPLTKVMIPSSAAFADLSTAKKYITFFDNQSKGNYCIDVSSGAQYVLSDGFKAFPDSVNDRQQRPFDLLTWIDNDGAILVRYESDIWQLDPRNKVKPICITGGSGRNNLSFFPLMSDSRRKSLALNDSLLLSVIDNSTKFNGFAKVKLSKTNILQISSLGPYIYHIPLLSERHIWPPKKAKNAEVYVFQRQSCIEEPNVFVTTDFNVLRPVSAINSHSDYKWHKSQLHRWAADDGTEFQGILYFPENLDTAKKYPIIFHYYEERSNELFKFNDPSFLGTNLNIAWYLNRGYIVFVPDIIRVKGATGPRALQTVVTAVKFLTEKYSWIDKSKMGLQGHSHGGYLTNFIVTHCNLFAAAQSGAGYSDFISGYGQLGFGQASLQGMQEIGQNNLGTTPWKDPMTYIDNSCIFSVDQVKTPLLILHNEDDDVVRFPQGLELFLALRREEKPVWMLSYDNERHGMWEPENVSDFYIRQQQFFDHYLKGKPAPLWMVEGIPATYKGIKSGLQLDTLSRTP